MDEDYDVMDFDCIDYDYKCDTSPRRRICNIKVDEIDDNVF